MNEVYFELNEAIKKRSIYLDDLKELSEKHGVKHNIVDSLDDIARLMIRARDEIERLLEKIDLLEDTATTDLLNARQSISFMFDEIKSMRKASDAKAANNGSHSLRRKKTHRKKPKRKTIAVKK